MANNTDGLGGLEESEAIEVSLSQTRVNSIKCPPARDGRSFSAQYFNAKVRSRGSPTTLVTVRKAFWQPPRTNQCPAGSTPAPNWRVKSPACVLAI